MARLAWFGRMIEHCHEYAVAAKEAGRPVVGILCEYTPRELIMAAGGVPVCLCGGSAKTIPAAEQHLPANLCPLIKSTYGYHVLRNNPFLEMADLVVGETTCDGKKKMYELMAESRPMYVLELPHKSNNRDSLEYWIRELDDFRKFLSQRFATEVTDEKIREAIGLLNQERRLAPAGGGADEGRSPAAYGPAGARLQEQHLGHARRIARVPAGARRARQRPERSRQGQWRLARARPDDRRADGTRRASACWTSWRIAAGWSSPWRTAPD